MQPINTSLQSGTLHPRLKPMGLNACLLAGAKRLVGTLSFPWVIGGSGSCANPPNRCASSFEGGGAARGGETRGPRPAQGLGMAQRRARRGQAGRLKRPETPRPGRRGSCTPQSEARSSAAKERPGRASERTAARPESPRLRSPVGARFARPACWGRSQPHTGRTGRGRGGPTPPPGQPLTLGRGGAAL